MPVIQNLRTIYSSDIARVPFLPGFTKYLLLGHNENFGFIDSILNKGIIDFSSSSQPRAKDIYVMPESNTPLFEGVGVIPRSESKFPTSVEVDLGVETEAEALSADNQFSEVDIAEGERRRFLAFTRSNEYNTTRVLRISDKFSDEFFSEFGKYSMTDNYTSATWEVTENDKYMMEHNKLMVLKLKQRMQQILLREVPIANSPLDDPIRIDATAKQTTRGFDSVIRDLDGTYRDCNAQALSMQHFYDLFLAMNDKAQFNNNDKIFFMNFNTLFKIEAMIKKDNKDNGVLNNLALTHLDTVVGYDVRRLVLPMMGVLNIVVCNQDLIKNGEIFIMDTNHIGLVIRPSTVPAYNAMNGQFLNGNMQRVSALLAYDYPARNGTAQPRDLIIRFGLNFGASKMHGKIGNFV